MRTSIMQLPFRPVGKHSPMACLVCESPLTLCPRCERLVCSKTANDCKHLRCDQAPAPPPAQRVPGRSLIRGLVRQG